MGLVVLPWVEGLSWVVSSGLCSEWTRVRCTIIGFVVALIFDDLIFFLFFNLIAFVGLL